MRRIHATLVDAEEHWNIREESAKLRLRELKEIAYGAEDVVEEYEYEMNRLRLEAQPAGSASPVGANNSNRKRKQKVNDEHFTEAGFVPVPNELALRARELTKRFDEMKLYYKHFSLSDNDGERRIIPDIHSMRQTSHFVDEMSIVGRESDKETVIQKLMSGHGSNNASHISVLAIVGMGGLGKTTMAQLVYKDLTTCQLFDIHAWVYVSESFDSKNLTKKIVGSITKESSNLSELDDLQDKLAQVICNKRCLFVLDDVWNERRDCWEIFCKPLLAAQKCKILVTTRNETVARLVQTMPHFTMDYLSPDESWELFEQTVSDQEYAIPGNLAEIGKKIVEKCDRLPLAIKTIGSMLRYETDERRWIDVLESELWYLDKAQHEILPALELSYKNMPIHLKRCFVALCLFPKDCPLEESDIIRLWKFLDIIQGDATNNEDEIGSRYFNELVQRSFLQLFFGSGIMHDLIHDLACHLSGNEFFRLEGDKPVQIPQNTRFMSILECDTYVQFSAASHPMWAIIVLGREGYSKVRNSEQFFQHCKNLRVLSIDYSNLCEALPRYISGLKLLRHLELTANRDDLEEPENAPSGIDVLINLHTLPNIHIRRCACSFNLRELRNLNKIRELRVSGLGDLSCIEDAKEVQLISKRHLGLLELDFSYEEHGCVEEQCKSMLQLELESTDEEMLEPEYVSHKEILESLRPHKGLKKLIIKEYDCQSYPRWLGNASFSYLTEIVISGRGWVRQQRVPTLGELPFLKSLKIRSICSVEHIGREFCSLVPGNKGFPSLTSLEFIYMAGWTEWSGLDDGDFPCLQTLSMTTSLRLRHLPLDRFPSLDTVTLNGCDGIKTIPAGGTFKKLCISRCAVLRTISAQPSLQELELKRCPELHEVGSMPNVIRLNIHECPNLSTVGSLPELTTVSATGALADGMLFSLLDYLPRLKSLYVSSGTVTRIPLEQQRLPSLAALQLWSCANLQYCDGLAGFTSLSTVNIWECPLLPSVLQDLHKVHVD